MKNNTTPPRSHAEETNVVYHFTCPDAACQRRKMDYIGLTTATIQQRMQGHSYNGAIKDHYMKAHNRRPGIDELVTNTIVIHRIQSKQRLVIAEAVSIALKRPSLNVQREFDYVLPSCRRRPGRGEDRTDEERSGTQARNTRGERTPVEPQTPRGEQPDMAQQSDSDTEGTYEDIRRRLRPRIRRDTSQ